MPDYRNAFCARPSRAGISEAWFAMMNDSATGATQLKFAIHGFIFSAALVMASVSAGSAPSAPPLSGALVNALKHGDCSAAVKLVNPLVNSNDEQTSFIAGRMLIEGLCTKKDNAAAADYFAHAAALGNHPAQIDYAALIGLGVGTEQSYARAGEVCRSAGLDSQAQVSSYTLGYACTLDSVASRVLRESVPTGAFRLGTDPALVEFTPTDAKLTISSTPPVRRSDPAIGSRLGAPMIDAQREINRAWGEAISLVPKPDAAKLDGQAIALSIDVDMTLEAGRSDPRSSHLGDLQPMLQPMQGH
jgi:hypothetical protein